MYKLRTFLFTAAGFIALAGALALTNLSGSRAAPVAQDVQVVNTTSQPVPTSAQGTTTVAGTVQAQQNGAWTVGLDPAANRVTVANTSPIAVTPSVTPVQARVKIVIDPSTTLGGAKQETIYTVPAGKLFVIEYASAMINTTSDSIVPAINTLGGGVSAGAILPFRPLTRSGGGTAAVSEQVRLYADPGTPVIAVLALNAGSSGQMTIYIVGYLVDAP